MIPTRSTPQPQHRCPQPRATGSCGCTPPPKPAGTPPPEGPASSPVSPPSKPSTSNSLAPGAVSRPASRSNQAATAALADTHAKKWVTFTVTETISKEYKQERAGRPGAATRYREIPTSHFSVHADIALDRIAYDAASDGCFPLISNDRDLSDAQVLGACRYQPNLECRHHLLKSVQDAAPVLLHNPARIEALFCCQFLALLICALIEREVRTGMRQAALDNIALYPEFRDCKAPSTERILEIFATIARHQLHRDGTLIQTFEPELSAQQQQVLDLLGLPHSAYMQPAQSTG